MSYKPPRYGLDAYTCPHCGVLAEMIHHSKDWSLEGHWREDTQNPVRTTQCRSCHQWQLWYLVTLLYPSNGIAQPPNPEMPDDVLRLYREAADVSGKSPRAAAALLRLGIQHLCIDLGGSGKNINDDIGALVKNGLPVQVQQALDVVRVVGNNAVHPGVIDVDDAEVVARLFVLLNVIVDYTIALPKRVAADFHNLPQGAKDAIEKRDKK